MGGPKRRLVLVALLALAAAPGQSAAPRAPSRDEEADDVIRRLGSPSFAERDAAIEGLLRRGEAALRPLYAAARHEDLELRLRALRLIDLIESRPVRSLEGHETAVWSVAVSPDGRHALTAGAAPDGLRAPSGRTEVRLWDLRTGKTVRRFAWDVGDLHAVAFSPGGRLALCAGEQKGIVWEPFTGNERRWFTWPPSGLWPLPASFVDERRIILGPTVWDVGTGLMLKRYGQQGDDCVAFSADGRRAAFSTEIKVRCCRRIGEALALGDWPCDVLQVTDPQTGTERGDFSAPRPLRALAWSSDGSQVVSASCDGTVILRDAGKQEDVRRLELPTCRVAFSQNCRRALAASAEGEVELWDLPVGKRLRRYREHGGPVHALAFVPDGRFALAAGADGRVRVYRLPP